jgi:hypothetical protein
MDHIEKIVKYKLDDQQVIAYKVCLMWVYFSRKMFPDYRHEPWGKGNPKKTCLFKHCYKLVKKTWDLMNLEDYRDYIQVQLGVLKHFKEVLVNPAYLNGDRAWKRWMRWKNVRNKNISIISHEQKPVNLQVSSYLSVDRKNIINKFGVVSKEILEKNTDLVVKMALVGKLSLFFVSLYPWFVGKISLTLPTTTDINRLEFSKVFPELV